MKQHTQTFSKGISQDLSTNKYPNTNIYWAQNFRLISKDGLATGALTNVKGTSGKLNIGNSEETILEMCLIRDTLITFVSSPEGGKIYKWDYNETDFEESATLIYTDPNLNFTTDYPVRAVGRYENENVQKIYFTDGYSFFKHLNIISDSYPITYDVDSLDLISDIDFSTITTELQSGGNLKAGRIQYSYQLYSVRGSESVYSPTSKIINITEAEEAQDTYYYYGSEVGTFVNKSVKVTITNPDELFTRLRLVALEYTVLNQIPSVRIVGEYDIENLDEITIVDNGSSIGELTLEEFRFIQNDFYPKTLDIKDNYLFAANIKNNYFNITDEQWDVRTFRANASDEIVVYEGNNSINVPYPFTTLPDFDSEAFCPYNNLSEDYNANNIGKDATQQLAQYKYQPGSGGTILGGKGPNITYEFTTTRVLLDDSNKTIDFGEGYPRLSVGASSTQDNVVNINLTGYQRDEIYRFAIVPIDLKGREGFAKWIGDIRFPNHRELEPYVEYDNTDGKTYANILGITFTVNIPSEVQNLISGYRIVRTERKSSDKTVIAQGIVGKPIIAGNSGSYPGGPYDDYLYSLSTNPTVNDIASGYTRTRRETDTISALSGPNVYVQNNIDITFDDRWLEFDSPDIAINKSKLSTSNAYIDVFGFQNETEVSAISGERGFEDGTAGQDEERDIIVVDKTRNFDYDATDYRVKANIDNFRVFQPKPRGSNAGPQNDATNYTIENGEIYNNQAFSPIRDNDIKPKWGLRGTHALLTVEENLPIGVGWYDSLDPLRFLVGNYKIDRGRSLYGGSTWEARSSSTYYPASEFIPKNTTEVDVYNGDTYISYFVFARSLYDKERADGYRIETYMMYPVESVINLNLRLDKIQDYINWGFYRDSGVANYKLMETTALGVNNYGVYYPTDVGNLYRYNSAYSSIDKSKEYFSEPFDFSQTLNQDVRIYASEKKINGEYTDSWTKFLFNNYIDVDSKHNAITKILTFKNNLFYFQPTAVGIAAVNQRVLLSDNNPGELTAGTGGILTRYDYVTDKSGSEYYDAILASDDFLFYADGRRKRINKLVPGKEEAISVIKGIDSTLDKLAWDSVVGGFDRGYNEVLFSIDGTTIAFSEMADAFMSAYSFSPGKMISIGKDFFSTGPSSNEDESPWLYADGTLDKVGYSGDTDVDPDWDYILIGPGAAGSSGTLYKHNVGDPGVFYNSATADDSYLTLILNPEGNRVCYFDNLDLRTESTSSGVDDPDDIFYRLEASNNYQEITRELNFAMNQASGHTGSIKRIGRVWRTPIVSATSNKRMVDTYLKVTLRYSNTGNTFRLHDVGVLYRPANH